MHVLRCTGRIPVPWRETMEQFLDLDRLWIWGGLIFGYLRVLCIFKLNPSYVYKCNPGRSWAIQTCDQRFWLHWDSVLSLWTACGSMFKAHTMYLTVSWLSFLLLFVSLMLLGWKLSAQQRRNLKKCSFFRFAGSAFDDHNRYVLQGFKGNFNSLPRVWPLL